MKHLELVYWSGVAAIVVAAGVTTLATHNAWWAIGGALGLTYALARSRAHKRDHRARHGKRRTRR